MPFSAATSDRGAYMNKDIFTGLQKLTLLDFPGYVACTLFTRGCNMRCPFCHNAELLEDADPVMTVDAFLTFLKKRQGILEGVCVTGGEPTLRKDLPDFIRRIKELGYLVKLDTNGYRPDVLKALVKDGLVDYVAMDIKNCPARYAETAGVTDPDISKIEESMIFLMEGDLDFEFRTTVVQQLHGVKELEAIGKWFQKLSPVHKVKKYFLQPYTDRDSVLCGGLSAPNKADLQAFVDVTANFVHSVKIRGLE